MYFQGGKIEGAIYGSVSPADYAGLAGWWRATDGITFGGGSRVFQWNDISGNNRHFTAMNRTTYAPIIAYGNITQTSNGLGLTGGDGSGAMGILSDYNFKNILYDGRKMSVTYIFKILGYTSGGNSYTQTSIQADAAAVGAGAFSLGQPSLQGTIAGRTLNSGVIIANNDPAVQTFNTNILPQSHILTIMDYGYDSASANLHRKLLIDNTIRTERKFTGAPSSIVTNTPLFVTFGGTGQGVMYEIILFDHTGKTTQQIDFEQQTLYNNYILPRYPNLFT